MAIEIREYLGNEGSSIAWNPAADVAMNITEATAFNRVSKDSIMVDIEGIHEGGTRNFTWYTKEALVGSIPTWTKPYLRPLILHHNEKDGRTIGRVHNAMYTDKNTRSNTGALIFTVNAADKEAVEQINSGILQTTSIGVIVHDARCSICGANIAEMSQEELESHEHLRGQQYEVNGQVKTCYWVINSMEAKELSYVIVPSDIFAHNVRIYKPTDSTNIQEDLQREVLNLTEQTQVIDEEVKAPTATEEKPVEEKPIEEKPAEETPAEKTPEELKAENETLAAQVATLTQEKEDAITAKDTAEGKVAELSAQITAAQTSLATAQSALTAKEAELSTAKSLREAAENELISLKGGIKTSLVENVNILRGVLGKKEFGKEELESRSEDSLKDAIKDLKEELSGNFNPANIPVAHNPAAVVEEKIPGNDVQESKTTGNIDLQKGVEDIFRDLFTPNH